MNKKCWWHANKAKYGEYWQDLTLFATYAFNSYMSLVIVHDMLACKVNNQASWPKREDFWLVFRSCLVFMVFLSASRNIHYLWSWPLTFCSSDFVLWCIKFVICTIPMEEVSNWTQLFLCVNAVYKMSFCVFNGDKLYIFVCNLFQQ